MLTAVSLFAGIGGIDLALTRAGVRVVAAVEIDAAARGVLKEHFPDVTLFNDVTEVTGDQLRSAGLVSERGIITAGWPCTGNSIAGKRQGMDDPRSGLWSHVVRLLRETGADWFLGENVPGLLSVNNGRDFVMVMTDLNDLGYITDVNVYDAQFFGVPQRRRRVVLTCQRAETLLRRKTITSALMLAQSLIEISLLSLVVLSQGCARGSAPWDSLEACVDGLRKRIALFGMLRPKASIYETWLPVLAGESVRQALARSASGSRPGGNIGDEPTPTAGTSSSDLTGSPAAISLNTASSWSALLDALLPMARSCTTSTPSRPTTTQAIYTCAQVLLNISEYIAALSSWSPDCWQPVSSALTAIEVLTNYARSTNGDLIAWMDGLHDLIDFVAPAERALHALRRAGDWSAPVQVLLEPEGGGGDSAAGGAARSGVAGVAALRASTGGADDNDATGGRLIAGPLQAQGSNGRGHRVDAEGAANGHLVPAISAKWAKGTGGPAGDEAQNLLAFDLAQLTSPDNRTNPQPGDPAAPLAATGQPHVAYAIRSDPGGTGQGHNTNYVPVYQCHGGSVGPMGVPSALQASQTPAVQVATAVRRLTPLECERLQGMPDGWTAVSDGRPQSDSARYRQLGNSVAVPVFEWVARRLLVVDEGQVAV